MAGLTSWATAVCAVAVICALFEILSPTGNVSKMLNFVLGLFLVTAVLVPFTNLINSKSFDSDSIKFDSEKLNFTQQADNLTMAVGKSAVEKLVANALNEGEIPYKKIEISMDSSTGKSIDIVVVNIYLESKQRNSLPAIKSLVKEKTGITPNVYVG